MDSVWGKGVSTIGVELNANGGNEGVSVAGAASMVELVTGEIGYTAVAVFSDSFCVHAKKNRHSTE